MAKTTLAIPKGTRDFNHIQMTKRNYIFSILRSIFEKHGYQPIETPSVEQLSTLLGKYGEEGDRLIFRILNSGDFMTSVPPNTENTSANTIKHIAEKGLRYDLTVPFARFVAMNRNDLTFPFRRYQMQPVWRADRPQKGRYREFYQCDVDVIGTNSQTEEAGIIEIIDTAFSKLGINVIIKINNRKILQGIAETIGANENFTDFTIAIDKLDKTGWNGVCKELLERGLKKNVPEKLMQIMQHFENNEDKIASLKKHLTSEIGIKGIAEVEEFFMFISSLTLSSEIKFDVSLARGLNYYTGAIFEVVAKDAVMGSISGGGRYDNLTGVFGFEGMSGVGVSFGADRIYDVMTELNLFPQNLSSSADILLINFEGGTAINLLKIAQTIRKNDISCVVYPEPAKLKKQFSYADACGYKYVLIQGPDEKIAKKITIKSMNSGKQIQLNESDINNISIEKIEKQINL